MVLATTFLEQQVVVDYVLTDLNNKHLLPVMSVRLQSWHEANLEYELLRDDLLDYPPVTDFLQRLEQRVASMRRSCDCVGCFNWKTLANKATQFIMFYKLRRLRPHHYVLHGFCLSACTEHAYVLKDFDFSWGHACFYCQTCGGVHFSSRSRVLNRTWPVCLSCRKQTINSDAKS